MKYVILLVALVLCESCAQRVLVKDCKPVGSTMHDCELIEKL